jgi:hypothetical protein
MNCAQVKDRLVDFLYDEMPADVRAAFTEHVRHCPTCSAEVAGYQKTLDHARTAMAGPLAQEPPMRVRLAVLEAAQAAAKAAPAPRSAKREELGFFARLLRTPWLLPAFGAAGIATAVFLVRVLKNPEVVPGQHPHAIDERALAPATPPAAAGASAELAAAPAPAATRAKHATEAELAKTEKAPSRLGIFADGARRERKAAPARTSATAGGTTIQKKKAIYDDPLDGLGLGSSSAGSGASASGAVARRYAEPPPEMAKRSAAKPRSAPAPVQDQDEFSDDLSLDQTPVPKAGADRAAPAPAAPPAPRYASPPASAAGLPSPSATQATAPTYAPAEEAAAPPTRQRQPARAAEPGNGVASEAKEFAPPPSKARAPRGETDESGAEPSIVAGRSATKDEASATRSQTGSSLEESVRKADRLFADQNWSAAATAYQDLLRRFPTSKDAPKWRDRMNAAAVAAREARKPGTVKAAKAKGAATYDSLDGNMR